jgi:voltage-gated potassium channel
MARQPATPTRSHAYSLFILVLTVYSLIIMVALLLPLSDQTLQLLTDFDNAICIVFLVDFVMNLVQAPAKGDYFIRGRGWLDLIGSIPTFGILRYTALLRLARLSRLARVARLLQTDRRAELLADIVKNRSRYAAFVTLMLAFIVLTTASIFVLQFESRAPDATIKTGGDALWWAIVTITTVGYGDTVPVTPAGRTTAVFVMFAGVGIIGALASILASVLVPSPDDANEAAPPEALEQQLAMIRGELAAMRQALELLERQG